MTHENNAMAHAFNKAMGLPAPPPVEVPSRREGLTNKQKHRRKQTLIKKQDGRCHFCGVKMTPIKDPTSLRSTDVTVYHLDNRLSLKRGTYRHGVRRKVAACYTCSIQEATIAHQELTTDGKDEGCGCCYECMGDDCDFYKYKNETTDPNETGELMICPNCNLEITSGINGYCSVHCEEIHDLHTTLADMTADRDSEERWANHYKAERDKYNEALRWIRDNEGKVCDEFGLCKHKACNSSFASWEIANEALREDC